MAVGHQATALAGVEVERAETLEQLQQRAGCSARTAASDHQRPLRRPEQFDRAQHGRRVGVQCDRRSRLEPLGCQHRVHRARGFGALGVHREVQVHRARLAAHASCARQRLVEFLQDQVGLAHGARVARERAHELGVQHVLQRATVLLRARRCAGQDQQRRTRGMRVGDPRHRVGHARPGSDQRHANAPTQLTVGMRHIDRGALVAHVDDANAFGIEPHPDRHDVAPAQREHAVNAARFEEARDQCGAAGVGDDGCGHLGLLNGDAWHYCTLNSECNILLPSRS